MTILCLLDLVLHDLGLYLEVGKLLAQSLGFDSQCLSLLFAYLDLLLHHDRSLNSNIVLGFHILKRGSGVSRLSLEVIIGHLYVAQLQLHSTVGITKIRNLLLQRILRCVRLGLCFPAFFLEQNISIISKQTKKKEQRVK